VSRRSGDDLLIKINKPNKRDVSGVDIQVIGLCGWVLGSHCSGLVVESLKGDPTICCKDRCFASSRTVARALDAGILTLLSITKPGLEVNDKDLQINVNGYKGYEVSKSDLCE